ncbi:metalloregulator ArsR/SmtB family transcription factor [Nakamurella aerolata]|uniref:helix-turn-helix transcriptional regulator n=1 Tax=Nakamurella aerolata TaxID=1656892 RepID=UPI0031B59567
MKSAAAAVDAVGGARHPRVDARAAGEFTGDGERNTRAAVLQLLLERPATASEIAERLGLTTAGVRRHLDALVDAGLACGREVPALGSRGRGRPARQFLLTDAGRSTLPHGYDQLAGDALHYLAEVAGDGAVEAFARRRAQAVVDAKSDELAAAPDLAGRLQVIAGALNENGFVASVQQVATGRQLCQHHCPVAHVAEQFPQLCQAELEVFAQALGTRVQRLATIAHGDSFCTTFVPGDELADQPADVTSASKTDDVATAAAAQHLSPAKPGKKTSTTQPSTEAPSGRTSI